MRNKTFFGLLRSNNLCDWIHSLSLVFTCEELGFVVV